MKVGRIISIVSILFLAVANVMASGFVGVYGIVERIVFEPNETAPERAKVWGAFALAPPGDWRPPTPNNGTTKPVVGYLYFKLPAGTSRAAARKEWNDLKSLAGTGQAIAFGTWDYAYWGLPNFDKDHSGYVMRTSPPEQESLRVHASSEKQAGPVTYSTNVGIVKLQNTGNYATLITMLRQALKP